MKSRAIRYPVHTVWHVCVLKAIDGGGTFRHAISISTPAGRCVREPRSSSSNPMLSLAETLVQFYEQTEWYAQPATITFDNAALCDAATPDLQERDVETKVVRDRRRSRRYQTAYEKFVKANPLPVAA